MNIIKPSPELLAVSRRWYDAVVSRNDKELQNFLTQDSALSFIGSADGEFWSGSAVREAIGAHFNEVPGVVRKEELFGEAYEQGSVGWSSFSHRFTFSLRPDEPVVFRTSLVFALQDGSWKIVHRHASIPVPNETIIGNEHKAMQALTEAAQVGFSLGQREGLASVMFTDIVASSALASAMGDRLWSDRIARHIAQLRQIIEDHDGQFVKSLGDGTMSSFTSARHALSAAAAIQSAMATSGEEPALGLRIGIHTGDVVQSDDDFFGNVVNKAARVAACAGPGEIRVSDATRIMVGGAPDFRFTDTVSVPLKGFEGEHVIHLQAWRP